MHHNQKSRFSGLVREHKVVFFAIVVLAAGIGMISIVAHFQSITSQCWNGKLVLFSPNEVVTANCHIVTDIWQDVNLKVSIWGGGAAEDITLNLPAHAEIKDPNEAVIYETDFYNGRITTSFRPQMLGTYTLTVTSLEDQNNRVYKGIPSISYSFGYIKFAETIGVLGIIGYSLLVFGIIFVLISAAKAATGRHNSLIFDS